MHLSQSLEQIAIASDGVSSRLATAVGRPKREDRVMGVAVRAYYTTPKRDDYLESHLELWSREGGRIGLLARLRDVLPGRYSFGVTGRDPTGSVLPTGDYQLRLQAYGTEAGPPTVRTVAFTIK